MPEANDSDKRPVLLPLWLPIVVFLMFWWISEPNRISLALVAQLLSFVYLVKVAYEEKLFTGR